MTTNSKRTIGAAEQRFNNIMNSRLELSLGHAGKVIRAKVSGKPNYGYYDPRLDALKDLYSFNVNKSTVIDSKWFGDQHAAAIAAEQAGEIDKATAMFNELLNASQLSFGIINRDATKMQFTQDQVVDLSIGVTDVAEKDENGNPTGVSHKALIVEGCSPVAATLLTKSRRFGAEVEESVPAAAETVAASAELAAITK
jgi:hypothetical protein